MKPVRKTSPLLLLAALAFVGLLLVYVPTLVVGQYRTAVELGNGWATLYLVTISLGAAILVGCSLWIVWRLWRNTRVRRRRKERCDKAPSQLTPAEQQRQMRENLATVEDLQSEAAISSELQNELKPLVGKIEEKWESQSLEIVAFGTISSGKSSLLNALAGRDVFRTDTKGGTTLRRSQVPWPGMDRVTLVDTPGLGEVDGQQRGADSAQAAKNADLVLMVVDGPLRDTEFELMRRLAPMEKRVLVCLNKEDWYNEQEKDKLLEQIAEQVKQYVAAVDVVAVRSNPIRHTRMRVLPDGKEVTETVEVSINIDTLARRMMALAARDGRDLLLANLLLQSRGLVEQARDRVREALNRRAWALVEKYMWGAGGAAALSPFPMFDLAAGCAISTKMVVELAKVYRQDVDISTAVKLLGELGKNLVAVLGVSLATPAAAAAIASLLKAVPGVGTIAGGMLQGLVLALVTRWIGAVFIEYFKNQMQEPEGGLTGLARRQWEHYTSAAELRKLVQNARGRLTEEGPS